MTSPNTKDVCHLGSTILDFRNVLNSSENQEKYKYTRIVKNLGYNYYKIKFDN